MLYFFTYSDFFSYNNKKTTQFRQEMIKYFNCRKSSNENNGVGLGSYNLA